MSFDKKADNLRLEIQTVENDIRHMRPVSKHKWSKLMEQIDELEAEYVYLLDKLGNVSIAYEDMKKKYCPSIGTIYLKDKVV